ncbi:unnamed protein product [Larinioides sclopetarius]|uniref:Uncharacterized protein n=1 Tax=Larinioides sclopetarius TaxID=280406 RepID=A0AAV1Z950_9ARAC
MSVLILKSRICQDTRRTVCFSSKGGKRQLIIACEKRGDKKGSFFPVARNENRIEKKTEIKRTKFRHKESELI